MIFEALDKIKRNAIFSTILLIAFGEEKEVGVILI